MQEGEESTKDSATLKKTNGINLQAPWQSRLMVLLHKGGERGQWGHVWNKQHMLTPQGVSESTEQRDLILTTHTHH